MLFALSCVGGEHKQSLGLQDIAQRRTATTTLMHPTRAGFLRQRKPNLAGGAEVQRATSINHCKSPCPDNTCRVNEPPEHIAMCYLRQVRPPGVGKEGARFPSSLSARCRVSRSVEHVALLAISIVYGVDMVEPHGGDGCVCHNTFHAEKRMFCS